MGLFTLQLFAMPLGACAQDAERHEAAGHVMGNESIGVPGHGLMMGDVTARAGHGDRDGSDPRDCVALSSCSAPVVTAASADEPFTGWVKSTREPPAFGGPIENDLRGRTPPPKI